MPYKELKEIVLRVLAKLENSGRTSTKRIKNQADTKNAITELKNTLEGIDIRLANTEEQISNLEHRLLKIN